MICTLLRQYGVLPVHGVNKYGFRDFPQRHTDLHRICQMNSVFFVQFQEAILGKHSMETDSGQTEQQIPSKSESTRPESELSKAETTVIAEPYDTGSVLVF